MVWCVVHAVLHQITLGGFWIYLLFALGLVAIRNKKQGNRWLASFAFIVALIQLCFYVLQTGQWSEYHPLLIVLQIPGLSLLPALFYFSYLSLLDEAPRKRYLAAHLAGVFFFIAWAAALPFVHDDALAFSVQSFGQAPVWVHIGFVLVCLNWAGYVAVIFRNVLFLREDVNLGIVIIPFLAGPVAIILLGGSFLFTYNILFLELATVTNTMAILTFSLIMQRYPHFLLEVKDILIQNKYKQSRLSNLDLSSIKTVLYELMKEEKLYRDEDIRLATVAEKLDLNTHQLSQFLNEQEETSFKNFINQWRIEEARELLLSQPDQSVLSIGFAVGFGSETSFYRTFDRFAQMTPAEYRTKSLP